MTGVWESAYVDSTVQTERTAAILTPNVLIISSEVDSGLSKASFFFTPSDREAFCSASWFHNEGNVQTKHFELISDDAAKRAFFLGGRL